MTELIGQELNPPPSSETLQTELSPIIYSPRQVVIGALLGLSVGVTVVFASSELANFFIPNIPEIPKAIHNPGEFYQSFVRPLTYYVAAAGAAFGGYIYPILRNPPQGDS